FTLLLRDKLEHAEKILILRWEIISYLLTLIASVVVLAALRSLSPVGWLAVALALGVLGLLTRRILAEAIGAEDLNKVHLMEAAIPSNATLRRPLRGTVEQISQQVTALARVTESLRASALAMADASHGMRQGAGELETFVAGGLQATDSLGAASRAMADQGARAAAASGTAAEVAAQKRAVIGEAIDRPVAL